MNTDSENEMGAESAEMGPKRRREEVWRGEPLIFANLFGGLRLIGYGQDWVWD